MNEKPVVGKPDTPADEAYHLDVYYKGAYVMHSLRFLLGDDIFFPMLKDLASHPPFTYENQTNTTEIIRYIEDYSSLSLGDFFNMYLYRTELPEVKISKKGKRGYEVSLPNIDFSIPISVATEHGIERIELSSQPVLIESSTRPEVDPQHWFLLDK